MSDTDRDDRAVAAELDAAHEQARLAYASRNAAAYLDTFHPDLVYTRVDGRSIGRDQLARDIGTQLARMHAASTEFRREALEPGTDPGRAIEMVEQRATFQVRAFGIFFREWSVRRRGRYEWLRTSTGWKLSRIHVLSEEVLPTRTWLAAG